jgi:hypothetical protein
MHFAIPIWHGLLPWLFGSQMKLQVKSNEELKIKTIFFLELK